MTVSQANSAGLPGFGPRDGLVRVEGELLESAAARLVSPRGPGSPAAGRRFLQHAREHRIPLDMMWAKLDEAGGVEATALAVPHPGKTAMIFASRTGGLRASSATVAVIERACRDAEAAGVRIAQTLLEPRERSERQTFQHADFRFLATLSYLERSPLSPPPEPPDWPVDVALEAYRESTREAFLAALHASYEDTLDCPGLSGLRKTENVLEGHLATGAFERDLWTLVRIDGRPSGVLMMNPAPAHNNIELVYLGLAKWARGRGLGRELLRRGLAQTSGRAERAITLAVDERNAPAIRLYFRHGFRRLLRRTAMIRPLNADMS